MKKDFPDFDLEEELKNATFARLTSRGVGISVSDAYFAVHHSEIISSAMQVAAQRTAEKISNSVRAGYLRPDETGTPTKAPFVSTLDYKGASGAQREDLKRQIRSAAARGEKLYPIY
jgi:hypothetical protein